MFCKTNNIKENAKISDVNRCTIDNFDYDTKFLFKIRHLWKKKTNLAIVFKNFLLENNNNKYENVEIYHSYIINIKISNELFKSLLNNVKNNYLNFFKKKKINKKVNIEIVSANPTGYIHIGHLRNAIVGRLLGNIYRLQGWDVEYIYYLNDAGTQIELLSESVYFQYFLINNIKKFSKNKDSLYKSTDIKECANELFQKVGEKYYQFKNKEFFELDDNHKSFIRNFALNYFLISIKKTLNNLNLKGISFYSEKNEVQSKHDNVVNKIKNLLSNEDYVYFKDGAYWIRTSLVLDDKDRVIQKSDGKLTYFASDIVYHLYRCSLNFDKYINIWGADHHGYINRILSVIKLYNEKNLDKWNFVIIQLVKVIKNNKEIKMSKRLGTNLTYFDLLKILNKNIINFYLVNKRPNISIFLDVDKIHIENKNNALYYNQYAYVRICSILKKLNFDVNLKNEIEFSDFTNLDKLLIKHFYEYNLMIKKLLNNNDPSLLCEYLLNLSKIIHKYYETINIIKEKNLNKKNYFCILLKTTKLFFENIFSLLELEVIDSM